jgi:hypothetical protein
MVVESPEIIHNRLKKRLNQVLTSEREYAVLKLQRKLTDIQLPPGLPEGSKEVFETLMESILETTNTSLTMYADAILTVVAEEFSDRTQVD